MNPLWPSKCMTAAGWQTGFKGHANVIDFERLHLHAPHATYDLPGGGRRLSQQARRLRGDRS